MIGNDDPQETARAEAFRQAQAARAANDRARLAALAGSRTARAALRDRWAAKMRRPDADRGAGT